MQAQRPISFVGVTASDDKTTETVEFDKPGVITRAEVSTEVGQEYALQVYASLIKDGTEISLWEPLDRDFLAGNGQTYPLDVRQEFEEGDVLRVEAVNVNTTGNEYHHNLVVGVDYETNLLGRMVSGLRGLI